MPTVSGTNLKHVGDGAWSACPIEVRRPVLHDDVVGILIRNQHEPVGSIAVHIDYRHLDSPADS